MKTPTLHIRRSLEAKCSSQRMWATASMTVLWRQFSGDTVGDKAKDIRCGLHSGIPVCCIVFYLDIWPSLPTFARRAIQMDEPPDVNYVRCLRCRDRVPIELQACRCGEHPATWLSTRRA